MKRAQTIHCNEMMEKMSHLITKRKIMIKTGESKASLFPL